MEEMLEYMNAKQTYITTIALTIPLNLIFTFVASDKFKVRIIIVKGAPPETFAQTVTMKIHVSPSHIHI